MMTPADDNRAICVPQDATCLQCGYPLRGLSSTHCPECGRAFDPADPLTMRTAERLERALKRAMWWAPLAVWLATILLAVLAYLFLLRRPSRLMLLVAILLAGFIRRRARRALLAGSVDPNPVSERFARIGGWILCGLILFVGDGLKVWSCPHGTGFGVSPIGVAHSTNGGPCGNHGYLGTVIHITGPWYVWINLFDL